jgi:hypothetical protein
MLRQRAPNQRPSHDSHLRRPHQDTRVQRTFRPLDTTGQNSQCAIDHAAHAHPRDRTPNNQRLATRRDPTYKAAQFENCDEAQVHGLAREVRVEFPRERLKGGGSEHVGADVPSDVWERVEVCCYRGYGLVWQVRTGRERASIGRTVPTMAVSRRARKVTSVTLPFEAFDRLEWCVVADDGRARRGGCFFGGVGFRCGHGACAFAGVQRPNVNVSSEEV